MSLKELRIFECLVQFIYKKYRSHQYHESKVLQKLAKVKIYLTTFHKYVLNEFLTKDLRKTFIKVHGPHLYASFGTFYAKIGQLFWPH